MIQANVCYKEVSAPINRYCCSGHQAAEEFKRGGPDSPAEPTRFFDISLEDSTGQLQSRGVYCEPCLVVVNYLITRKKKHGI